MKKTIFASLAVMGVVFGAAGAAQARSITHLVPAAQLNAFCATKPANAHVNARFTKADGTVVTGTIECEKANGGHAGGSLNTMHDNNGNGRHDSMGEGNEHNGGYGREGNEGNESLSHEANEGPEGNEGHNG